MKKSIVTILVVSFSIVCAATLAYTARAVDIDMESCRGVDSVVCDSSTGETVDNIIKNVVNFLLWLIGILSVVMVVFGGIKYTTSMGDSGKLQSAKNTILYSVIGLAVAILSYALVNFVFVESGNW